MKKVEELKPGHREKALEIVRKVDEELKGIGVDVPFYIAGGSVFSIFTGTYAKDIDVFFYTEEDLEEVVSAVYRLFGKYRGGEPALIPTLTDDPEAQVSDPYMIKNAVTVTRDSVMIQFIRVFVGHPEEIMKRFDLSCSMIAVDRSGDFWAADDYSREIKVHTQNFTSSTFQRFCKYSICKGASFEESEVKKMIRHACSIADQTVPMAYGGAEWVIKGTHIIREILARDYRTANNVRSGSDLGRLKPSPVPYPDSQSVVYETLHELFSGKDLIEVFKNLDNMDWRRIGSKMSPEFVVSRKEMGGHFWADVLKEAAQVEEAKDRYPEYFI